MELVIITAYFKESFLSLFILNKTKSDKIFLGKYMVRRRSAVRSRETAPLLRRGYTVQALCIAKAMFSVSVGWLW